MDRKRMRDDLARDDVLGISSADALELLDRLDALEAAERSAYDAGRRCGRVEGAEAMREACASSAVLGSGGRAEWWSAWMRRVPLPLFESKS